MSKSSENAINTPAFQASALAEKLSTDPRYSDVLTTIRENSVSAFIEGSFEELAHVLTGDGYAARSLREIAIPENPHELTDEAAIIRDYQRRILHGKAQQGYAGNTRISLHSKEQVLDGRHYALEDTVIKLSFVESEAMYICRLEEDNPFGIVTIGDNCQCDDKDAYFENEVGVAKLDEFCMLSLIGETRGGKIGIFTAYSKSHNVLFTEFVTGAPDLSSAQLSPRTKAIDSSASGEVAVELLLELVRSNSADDDEQRDEVEISLDGDRCGTDS